MMRRIVWFAFGLLAVRFMIRATTGSEVCPPCSLCP